VLVKYKAAIIIITIIISLNANCSRQDISEDVLILALITSLCSYSLMHGIPIA
jgi:hypothetical protein